MTVSFSYVLTLFGFDDVCGGGSDLIMKASWQSIIWKKMIFKKSPKKKVLQLKRVSSLKDIVPLSLKSKLQLKIYFIQLLKMILVVICKVNQFRFIFQIMFREINLSILSFRNQLFSMGGKKMVWTTVKVYSIF